MRRMRSYIFREFLLPTFLGLGVYTFLFILKLLFDLADLAIRKQVPLALLGEILLLALPRLLAITLPMAVLLGVLVGMARLSSEGELTALRACGVSYTQMLVPVVWLGTIAMLVVAVDAIVLIPRATFAQHKLNAEILLAGDISRALKPRVFYQDIAGILLYANHVERDGTLIGAILVQKTPGGAQRLTLARRARITQDRSTGALRFFLQDGETHTSTPDEPLVYERARFKEEVLFQPADENLLQFAASLREGQRRNYREMSTPALLAALGHLPGPVKRFSPDLKPRAQVELHRRFALPVACLLFALLAFPLGIVTRRGGRSSGFSLSLLVIVGYWLIMTGGENLAVGRAVPAWAATWFPNALALLVASCLFAWLVRDRRLPRPWLRLRRRWARRKAQGAEPVERMPRRRRRRPIVGRPGLFAGRLDQYLLYHYARAFVLVISSFYILYFLADLRGLLDDITRHPNLAYSVVLRYFALSAPAMVLLSLPLAALFAALLSLGILSRNNEITAMKAAGISLYRVSLPVLGTAFVLCVAHFVVSETFLPAANTRAAELRSQIRNVPPASTFGPRQWVFGQGDRLYNFALYQQRSTEYQGLTIYQISPDRSRLLGRIDAQRATYKGGAWVLSDGLSRDFSDGEERFEQFDETRLELPEGPEYFRRGVRPPQQMSFGRLKTYIAGLRQAGYDVQELEVALHEKVSMAAVPFVLVLLGLPYAFRRGRHGALAGAGLALAVAVVYYVLLALFRAMGGAGWIPPIIAAWAADLLFAGVGIFQMLSLKT